MASCGPAKSGKMPRRDVADAAYLDKHGLGAVMDRLLKAVLEAKPEDPLAYLAAKVAEEAATAKAKKEAAEAAAAKAKEAAAAKAKAKKGAEEAAAAKAKAKKGAAEAAAAKAKTRPEIPRHTGSKVAAPSFLKTAAEKAKKEAEEEAAAKAKTAAEGVAAARRRAADSVQKLQTE